MIQVNLFKIVDVKDWANVIIHFVIKQGFSIMITLSNEKWNEIEFSLISHIKHLWVLFLLDFSQMNDMNNEHAQDSNPF